MRTITVHNPCNEHTRYYRNYNLFWDDLTNELKKKYIVNENRYYEFANSQRFDVKLKKQTCGTFLLMECEYVIEFEDTGDFYVLSVSDDLSHAILNERDNKHLKKVLISQYIPSKILDHVSVNNIIKYKPWVYFPSTIDDLSTYYKKRQSINTFIDKMYFRGTSLEDRPILSYINKNYIEGISPIGNQNTYFNDLINYKVGLSVGGRGELCYRDIEYMSIGVPFIRFKYNTEMNPSLIPNFHYISIERPEDLPLDRMGNYSHAKMIEDRFLSIKNDNEFLKFISINAKQYYETYLSQHNNVNHTLKLLEI